MTRRPQPEPVETFQVHGELPGVRVSRLEHRIIVHQLDRARVLSPAEAKQLADALAAAGKAACLHQQQRAAQCPA